MAKSKMAEYKIEIVISQPIQTRLDFDQPQLPTHLKSKSKMAKSKMAEYKMTEIQDG